MIASCQRLCRVCRTLSDEDGMACQLVDELWSFVFTLILDVGPPKVGSRDEMVEVAVFSHLVGLATALVDLVIRDVPLSEEPNAARRKLLDDAVGGSYPGWAPGLVQATFRWSLDATRTAVRNVGFRTATWLLQNHQRHLRLAAARATEREMVTSGGDEEDDFSSAKSTTCHHAWTWSRGEIMMWSLETKLLMSQSACAHQLGEGHFDSLLASADTDREELN